MLSLSVSILFATVSQGQWVKQTSPTTQMLNEIFILNPTTLFVAGDNQTILKTTNGGATWIKLKEYYGSFELIGIYFQNENTGIAVGGMYIGGNNKGAIFRTTNGGTTWDSTAINKICFRKLCFINSTTGFAGGWKSAPVLPLFKTTNGGINWVQVNNVPFLDAVTAISFINENTGWAAGDSLDVQGVIKTTNGGINWFKTTNFSGQFHGQIFSSTFINENTGWLTGVRFFPTWTGLIMKTTDGGFNWAFQENHCYNEVYEIFFINENTGWVGSDGPLMQKTTNGGVNWNIQPIPAQSWCHGVKFIDANTGWSVSGMGDILYTVNGGGTVFVQNISTEVPLYYVLNQNYPNPFNPSTKIRYSIVKSGFVKLVVFDALGREVETLVNQSQQAGTYEASFTSANYPSGVYFYKLTTGDFSSVKKMVLLK